jgi:hypothetical protein
MYPCGTPPLFFPFERENNGVAWRSKGGWVGRENREAREERATRKGEKKAIGIERGEERGESFPGAPLSLTL